MDNIAITHGCGHTGYTSPRITDRERGQIARRPCPSCTTEWETDGLAQDLARTGCRQCGPHHPLKLLRLLTAAAPTAQALAGVQVKTTATEVAWAACTNCHRWSRGR